MLLRQHRIILLSKRAAASPSIARVLDNYGVPIMIRRQILLAAVIAFPIAARPGTAQEVGSAGRGLVLARQVCAQCHAVEKQQAQSPNADVPAFREIASIPGMTAIALSAALNTSHQTMPNLILNPNERADIVAYILA
jgi:mono/diheme cytochrome c family protein